MSLVASAPGKLVLIGEYVVLEGAPALVAAMDRRARVVLDAAPDYTVTAPALGASEAVYSFDPAGQLRFVDATLQRDPRWHMFTQLAAFVRQRAQTLGTTLPPCRVHLDTDAFFLHPGGAKLGLGSSAALAVALLAALLAHAGLLQPLLPLSVESNRHAFLTLAQAAHTAAQGGVGSGVDIAASIWGGHLRFQRPREGGPLQAAALPARAPVRLVAVWSGASASTPELLARVAAFKQASAQQYWDVYEKLAIYAHAAAEFWALGNTDALLTVVDAYYHALVTLGQQSGAPIVTPAHAEIYAQARAAGGFYKSSGAGGGDLGLVFCASEQVVERVKSRMRARGHHVVPLRVDAHGLNIASA